MMEFGALHCTPKNPNCLHCPLQAQCLAFAHQTVMQRPVKLPKVKVTTRYFNYLVISFNDCVYLHKRSGNDIWKNLYDFPCIESETPLTAEEVVTSEKFRQLIEEKPFSITKVSPVYTHKLTHRTLLAQFIEIKLEQKLLQIETKDLFLTPESELGSFPIPRLIDLYLNH
jgi:A/G-specific adenine glycosylase